MTDQTGPQEPAGQPQPGNQDQGSWVPPVSPQPQAHQPPEAYGLPAQGNPQFGWPGQGPWQGSRTPPPTRPTRFRAVVVGTIVAFAAAIIAGTGGYEIGVHQSRISSDVQTFKAIAGGACPPGGTVPDPSATSPAGAALLARALPMPPGDTSVTAMKQGVLSLEDYMNELFRTYSPERALLTALCFQTAVHRTWRSPGGTTTSVWLIQFRTAADARSFTLKTEQADKAEPANTDVFRVARVSDGMGLANPKLDKYGDTYTHLLGDTGNVAMIIHIFLPASTDNAAAAAVLQAQRTRLTAGSS